MNYKIFHFQDTDHQVVKGQLVNLALARKTLLQDIWKFHEEMHIPRNTQGVYIKMRKIKMIRSVNDDSA